jgi:TonB family protein
MRQIVFMCALLALAVTGVRAQQGAPAAAPGPVFEKSPAVVPYKPAHASNKAALQACPAKFEYRPEDGIYRVGGGIQPPILLNSVEVNFPDGLRKTIKKQHLKDFHAVSMLTFVVSAQGIPQDICVQRTAGDEMDEEAVIAAKQYLFRPAAKADGTPVAVRITLEVHFRL